MHDISHKNVTKISGRESMSRNLEKNYNPKDFEKRIYTEWESNGLFKPDEDRSKEPYTIIMPPPNITGQLHMGHALDQTIQDVLIRWKRMKGYSTLWIPGTDHASISTESFFKQKTAYEIVA